MNTLKNYIVQAFTWLHSLLIVLFSLSYLLKQLGYIDSVHWLPISFALLAIAVDIIMPDKKDGSALTSEWAKWHVRYSYASMYIVIAFAFYTTWQFGAVHGKTVLIVNPFMSAILAIVAIFKAWEISISLIVFAILYWLVLGIVSIPISAAILVSACIISAAIVISKRA